MSGDDKAFCRAVDEMTARVPSFQFDIGPLTTLAVISCLQLALRHPGMGALMRTQLREFVDDLLDFVHRQSPTVADFMRRGDNPAFDVQA